MLPYCLSWDELVSLLYTHTNSSYIVGVGYLLFSIYGMKTSLGNIGHDAHFGGAVGGFCLTLIVAPWVLENQLWVVLLLAAPIGLLMFLKKNNKL